MSINGIGASTGSMMYAYVNQVKQTTSSDSSSTSSILSINSGQQNMGMPPPYASDENTMMANEMGVRMRMGEDTGFTADELSQMAEDDSSMSELFSALSDNFDTADTNSDGVITQDEAMSYADENGIDVPAPPEQGGAVASAQTDTGFTADELSQMAEDGSPMSELFSALSDNFDSADTNSDGVITQDEAMAYADENGIDMPPPPPPGGPMMAGTDSDTGFTADQLSEMASEDSSMSELFSALSENFDSADTNGDGVVSRDEAMAYAKNNDISFPAPGDNLSVSA